MVFNYNVGWFFICKKQEYRYGNKFEVDRSFPPSQRLIKANLIIKDGDKYKFNFAIFTKEQFDEFKGYFDKDNAKLDEMLSELITDIHKNFKACVPKRLDKQINQGVSYYVHNIIGFIAEELISRGVLEKPDDEKPLTNGVFSILGQYLKV